MEIGQEDKPDLEAAQTKHGHERLAACPQMIKQQRRGQKLH